MLEVRRHHDDRNGKIINFHNNEFYAAIMDEDVECLEGMSNKYGSNFVISMQDGEPGEVSCKGPAILPLHLAASYGRVKSMQSLLLAGAEPEMRDHLGRTTLHLVITGWPRLLSTRLRQGSKVWTAVTGVCRQSEACLRLLCEHGVNINAEVEGENHSTALHLSVHYMALSAVHILASYGADVNAVDSSGMTPLHMAAGMLCKDIVTSLITEGADINMGVKHSGNTPLHLAVLAMAMRTTKTLEDNICCISELFERGAVADVANKAGLTALQEACCRGKEELVDLLLRYGADVNKLSKAGENCLFLFLNHKPNLRNSFLLVKLLSLTSPLTVYNQDGHLPSTLMLPCFFKQRDQLLTLIKQPRRLQDICKSAIYLKHAHDKREELREILPEILYDFVFNYWENLHDISFVIDSFSDFAFNPS